MVCAVSAIMFCRCGGVVPEDSKEKLAGVLTDEEYKTVTDRGCKVRFKYLTFINELLGL